MDKTRIEDMSAIQSPESNVMALAWPAIDCLLEADVLTTTEKIKGTERNGRKFSQILLGICLNFIFLLYLASRVP